MDLNNFINKKETLKERIARMKKENVYLAEYGGIVRYCSIKVGWTKE